MAQWATFLRNHDELDLSRLTDEQRSDVFARVRAASRHAPLRPRASGAGWRRCCGGDRRRIELAYSLQFTMPGTPVLRYGEEIGMGEDLALPGRDAIRTPMQWDASRGGGFSLRPQRTSSGRCIARGASARATGQRARPGARPRFAAQLVRADDPHPARVSGDRRRRLHRGRRPHSPARCSRTASTRPRARCCSCTTLPTPPVTVDLDGVPDEGERPPRGVRRRQLSGGSAHLWGRLDLAGWGYRWIRLRRGRPVTARFLQDREVGCGKLLRVDDPRPRGTRASLNQ